MRIQNLTIEVGDPSLSKNWPKERLDSWKEVASFFRREVRTVQFWEKREGLPVRRHHHKKLGSVYAYRFELEQWWIARSAMENSSRPPEQPEVREVNAKHSVNPRQGGEAPERFRVLTMPLEVSRVSTDSREIVQMIDRFAEGLRDEFVVELHRLEVDPIVLAIRELPSPGSSTPALMKTIAKEFSVDALLCGSLRHSGGQIHLAMQLIDGADLRCLWADRFDVVMDDPLKIQRELASRIAQAIPRSTLRGSRLTDPNASGKRGVAYHAYSLGTHFWNQRGRTSILKAISYLEDALQLDPKYADAYAGLANAYVSLSYNHMMSPRLAALKATAAVQAAIKIEANSITVRNAMINVLMNCTWDWSEAERECRDLIDSGNLDSRTVQLYSGLLASRGRHQEAISLGLHAHRLDPQSAAANGQVSLAYFYAGDYDSALSFSRRAVELRPDFTMGYAAMGRIEAERHNWDEALKAFHYAHEGSNQSPFSRALMAYAHAGRGDAQAAQEILLDLENESEDECFPAYDISAAYAMLKQRDKALQHIGKACDSRDMKTIYVNHDPRFANLRGLSAFHEIVAASQI
jgi:TolB-like protein/Tfp pilus assembly protein PilF